MLDVIDYRPEMDTRVVKAVEDVLKTRVISLQRLLHGEQNFIYKLTTDFGFLITRIFREKWWPEEDKYLWVESRLNMNNISHAKLKYHTRDSKYFRFGFMVLEFVEGINGEEAIKTGLVSFKAFHQKLFKLLSVIHLITLNRFGLIKNGKGEFENYEEERTAHLKESIEEIKKIPNFDLGLLKDVDSVSRKIWRKNRLPPVLIHGDATPDNSILTKDGEIILIDWDNARGGIWFDDYGWILYCGSHITQEGTLGKRREIIWETSEEIRNGQNLDELEKIYNLTKAVDLLPHYYFTQRNKKQYEYTLDKLKCSLKILAL